MDKRLRIVIALCIVVVAASVAYYFLFFLPAQAISAALANDRAQCADQAQKVIQSDKSAAGWPAIDNSLFGQENHYNTTMGKCFALLTAPGGPSLVDAYENTDLAGCSYDGEPINSSTACWIMIGGKGKSINYQQFEDFVGEAMQSASTTPTPEFPYTDY